MPKTLQDLFGDRPERLEGPRTLPNGERFPWGPIIRLHEIDVYWVVEYHYDASDSGPSLWKQHGLRFFHPYVSGQDTQRSFHRLDSAIIGAIVYDREGENSNAAYYIDRMTGVTWPPY